MSGSKVYAVKLNSDEEGKKYSEFLIKYNYRPAECYFSFVDDWIYLVVDLKNKTFILNERLIFAKAGCSILTVVTWAELLNMILDELDEKEVVYCTHGGDTLYKSLRFNDKAGSIRNGLIGGLLSSDYRIIFYLDGKLYLKAVSEFYSAGYYYEGNLNKFKFVSITNDEFVEYLKKNILKHLENLL